MKKNKIFRIISQVCDVLSFTMIGFAFGMNTMADFAEMRVPMTYKIITASLFASFAITSFVFSFFPREKKENKE